MFQEQFAFLNQIPRNPDPTPAQLLDLYPVTVEESSFRPFAPIIVLANGVKLTLGELENLQEELRSISDLIQLNEALIAGVRYYETEDRVYDLQGERFSRITGLLAHCNYNLKHALAFPTAARVAWLQYLADRVQKSEAEEQRDLAEEAEAIAQEG